MLIIGEKLNSSIPRVHDAFRDKDKAFVQELAALQARAGAGALDINTAVNDEVNDMEWAIRTVQEVVDIPICIDSTNPAAITRALQTVRGKAMINSISLESARIGEILPLVIEAGCPVIALTINDDGIPKTSGARVRIAEQLVELLAKNNYNPANAYIDPLVLPLSVDAGNAVLFFECIAEIKQKLGVKTISGLSNVSASLPMRKIINRYFLSISMSVGMDAAIMDPLDRKLMTAVKTTELITGKDSYARRYLKAFRASELED